MIIINNHSSGPPCAWEPRFAEHIECAQLYCTGDDATTDKSRAFCTHVIDMHHITRSDDEPRDSNQIFTRNYLITHTSSDLTTAVHCTALNDRWCADVPLRTYTLTHPVTYASPSSPSPLTFDWPCQQPIVNRQLKWGINMMHVIFSVLLGRPTHVGGLIFYHRFFLLLFFAA